MKNLTIVAILSIISTFAHAQFYCDFTESKSFYDESSFIRSVGITKEVIVIKQLKNDVMEDSFKIIVINYDGNGKPVSRYQGSKWNSLSLLDTFAYTKKDNQNIANVTQSLSPISLEYDVSAKGFDTVNYLKTSSEYDSVKRIKKIFRERANMGQRLYRLIFYDEQKKDH